MKTEVVTWSFTGFHQKLLRVSLAGRRPHLGQTHLEDVIGTLAAEVVLTWKNDHWFGKHLQTDGTDELLLQAVHEDDGGKPESVSRTDRKAKKKGQLDV